MCGTLQVFQFPILFSVMTCDLCHVPLVAHDPIVAAWSRQMAATGQKMTCRKPLTSTGHGAT